MFRCTNNLFPAWTAALNFTAGNISLAKITLLILFLAWQSYGFCRAGSHMHISFTALRWCRSAVAAAATQWVCLPDCFETGEGSRQPPLPVNDMNWGRHFVAKYVLVSIPIFYMYEIYICAFIYIHIDSYTFKYFIIWNKNIILKECWHTPVINWLIIISEVMRHQIILTLLLTSGSKCNTHNTTFSSQLLFLPVFPGLKQTDKLAVWICPEELGTFTPTKLN